MESLLPHRSDPRELISYKKSRVIYEMTYYFCSHFLKKGDRTIDQMVQAARSCKQNIIEGCSASATSSKTEIHLLSVAKASLQELVEDYIDYLATRGHQQWQQDSEEWKAMRELGRNHAEPEFFMKLCETRPPETIATMAIILIKQCDYLLYRQLESLGKAFAENGGFSERMTRIRLQNRQKIEAPR